MPDIITFMFCVSVFLYSLFVLKKGKIHSKPAFKFVDRMFFLYSARTENDRKDKRTASVSSTDQSVENISKCSILN